MNKVELIEKVSYGMTKSELIMTGSLFVIALCVLIVVLSYILRLHLKPLSDLPGDVKDIKSQVKSESELNLMIDNKIQDHALNCPNRKGR